MVTHRDRPSGRRMSRTVTRDAAGGRSSPPAPVTLCHRQARKGTHHAQTVATGGSLALPEWDNWDILGHRL